ncbi:hypothetical protein [Erwinia sp. PsM31]|uniref:hypothetical protein n=1 Tax=Erwinia sp. PsM31 TaxID=3030535 RepID=UPI00263A8876|nr:hypothetical protein [Erwinia sp. PsM31]MDN4628989.1 hypothetical protein [Erwinia sp. PsM31]
MRFAVFCNAEIMLPELMAAGQGLNRFISFSRWLRSPDEKIREGFYIVIKRLNCDPASPAKKFILCLTFGISSGFVIKEIRGVMPGYQSLHLRKNYQSLRFEMPEQ